jgi:VWFA-related protein
VDLLAAGDYTWSGTLYNSTGAPIETARNSGRLAAGRTVALLSFDGARIGRGAVDGPYSLREFVINGPAGAAATWTDAGPTAEYRYDQFESAPPRTTPPPPTTPPSTTPPSTTPPSTTPPPTSPPAPSPPGPAPEPGALAIRSLSPSAVTAGDFGFTLTVTGAGFVNGSVVRWNSVNRPTTFVSATELTAAISSADIANLGTVAITVANNEPAPAISNVLNLTIEPAPPPALSVLINQLDLAECPTVRAFVSVRDTGGTPIPRLTASQLTCTEDGAAMRCAVQPVSAAATPLSAVVIVPTNGLTAAEVDAVKAAARTFVSQIAEADRAGIIHLETQARGVASLTSDKNQLRATIDQIREVGTGHALYDAVGLAASTLASERGRRQAIVLFTHRANEGGATTNITTALSALRNSGVPLFAVAFGQGLGSAALGSYLKQAVADSSGALSRQNAAAGLTEAAERIMQVLREQYQLTYTSPNQDPANRTLSVLFNGSQGSATGTRVRPGCRF